MTAARATLAGASIGLIAAAAESLRPSLTPRSTLHQGLVTGTMAVTGAALGAVSGRVVGHWSQRRLSGFGPPAAAVSAVAVVAVVRGRRHLTAQQSAHTDWGPREGTPALGAVGGAAAAAGLGTAAAVIGRELKGAGESVSERLPGPPVLWTGVAATGAGVGTVVLSRAALRRVLKRLAQAGRAPDKALATAPTDEHVAGGPGSLVDYDTLSREGRRYVNWRVSAADLAAAGYINSTEPVRVYIGVDSADSITDRVDLAIAELDRLHGWDREVIIAVSPAGSGYANSVPVEALEFVTNGNCASVVIQYGVLPSMFSMDILPIATETFRMLIDRIHERISTMPEGHHRPRLLLYGESLGAQAAQVALQAEPSLVDVATASVAKVDGALFVGTPGGPSLRNELRGNPRTVHVDRWQALPDPLPDDVQLWFLEHDADPVTRFSGQLIADKPHWLEGDDRGRNVPSDMRWVPLGTWQQVLFDVAYATQAQSGVFRSVGHDYRADLAPLVAAAFEPRARDQVDQVQALLADREVTRDRRLAEAEGE